MTSRPLPLTTVILAGGQGRRIGGDKGMQLLQGKPLIGWVLDRVRGDSSEVLLNVNGELAPYRQFGCRLVADRLQGWQGPLAGIQSALENARTEYVMSVPCDTPFLPKELLSRLFAELHHSGNEAAVAVAGGHRQPAVALFNRRVLPGLEVFLAAGKRKVNDWLDTLRLSEVVFDNAGAFDNINSREDLEQAGQHVVIERAANAGSKKVSS